MQNPWKVATLGLIALGAIVGTSTLTTAYLLRPPVSPPQTTPATLAPSLEPQPAVVRVAPPSRPISASRVVAHATRSVTPAAARELTPAPLSAAAITPVPETPVAVSKPAVVTSTSPSAAATPDCETGGDRAARIAKPGALGALLGAGLGAAGGTVANGGKGAGQGALIGGLAGAALGAGYGAYKTKTECGTVFGEPSGATPSAARGTPRDSDPAVASGPMAPLQATPPRSDRIQIYDVR